MLSWFAEGKSLFLMQYELLVTNWRRIGLPFFKEPMQLSSAVQMLDVQGWDFHHTTGVLIIRGREIAIIETGHTKCGDQILNALQKQAIPLKKIRYVCVTHRHGDHLGGATPLAAKLPNVIITGHKFAIATLHDPERLNKGARQLFGKFAQDILPLPSTVATQELEDGNLIELGKGIEIEVVGTPGHTSDHLAYFERKTRTMYTGDAAGLLGPIHHTVTPTSFPPSFKFSQYRASLEKLLEYDSKFLVFSHFGAVTGTDVTVILNRALVTLDSWKDTVETAWQNEPSESAVIKAIEDKFSTVLEVFPPEARPLFIQVMAAGLSQSLLPKKK
jgi:glyoxylase-like metal-dependent hydrolase (beta-lactamase superfamily II)